MINQSTVKNKSSYYFLNKETKNLGKYDDSKKGEGITEEGSGMGKLVKTNPDLGTRC